MLAPIFTLKKVSKINSEFISIFFSDSSSPSSQNRFEKKKKLVFVFVLPLLLAISIRLPTCVFRVSSIFFLKEKEKVNVQKSNARQQWPLSLMKADKQWIYFFFLCCPIQSNLNAFQNPRRRGWSCAFVIYFLEQVLFCLLFFLSVIYTTCAFLLGTCVLHGAGNGEDDQVTKKIIKWVIVKIEIN